MRLASLLLTGLIALSSGIARGDDPVEQLMRIAVLGESDAARRLRTLADRSEGREAIARYIARQHALSEAGNQDAAYRLARIYREGLGVSRDPTEALRQLKLAAERSHPAGMTELAMVFEVGKAGSIPSPIELIDYFRRDDRKAAALLKQAAEKGYLPAIHELSRFHQDGKGGLPRDPSEARRLLEQTARANYAPSQFALGVHYASEPEASSKAAHWFALAASQGYEPAWLALGQRAERGEIEAITALADLHEGGPGRAADPVAAIRYWKEAARQGDARSTFKLGLYAEQGHPLPEEALTYFRRAGQKSFGPAIERIHFRAENRDVGAMFTLAEMTLAGEGVPEDRKRALSLYQAAAKLGHPPALNRLRQIASPSDGDLAAFLAFLYERGIGIPASVDQSRSWYLKSADWGSVRGQHWMARMLALGDGAGQNLSAAIGYYAKVYRQGHPFVLLSLERMARQGNPLAWQTLADLLNSGFEAREIQTSLFEVNAEETVQDLAVRLSISLPSLLEANPQWDASSLLKKGDTLVLPVRLPTTAYTPPLPYAIDDRGRGNQDIVLGLWKQAAAHGLADAHMALGQFSERLGKQDEAAEWYAGAALRGHAGAAVPRLRSLSQAGSQAATVQLCELTRSGVLSGDPYRCYQEAMERGIVQARDKVTAMATDNDPRAQFILGKAYMDGPPNLQDPNLASHWLGKAMDRGLSEAGLALGDLQRRRGDLPRGLATYRRAAEQGSQEALSRLAKLAGMKNLPATLMLAEMHLAGPAAVKDEPRGWQYLRDAANLGDSGAILRMARYSIERSDKSQGINWYSTAAAQGNLEAMAMLKSLALAGELSAGKEVTRLLRARADEPALTLWLIEMAKQGDAQASLEAADRLLKGTGALVNPVEALILLRKAADLGDREAQQRLGSVLEKPPFPMAADISGAIGWYARAAQNGHPEALASLNRLAEGTFYAEALMALGEIAEIRGAQSEAAGYYLRAAQRGHLPAMHEVANRYASGSGLIKDATTAFDWKLKAARAGDAVAQMKVGIAYYEGQGVMSNPREALTWLKRAAHQKEPFAALWLGYLYLTGNAGEQDYTQAMSWYTKAAQLNVAQAQSALGQMYLEGLGVPVDHKQAIHWYQLASTNEDPLGMTGLGTMLEDGLGIERDLPKAIRLYEQAAMKGDADANYRLGRLYREGKGVQKSVETSARLMEKAAEGQVVDAQFEVGKFYLDGIGVKKNLPRGLMWLQRAAQQDHFGALWALAQIYLGKNTANGDAESTFRLVRCLAETDSSDVRIQNQARMQLGQLYKDGRGVEANPILAHCWFNLSAAADVEGAAEARDKVEEELSETDKAQASQCARERFAPSFRPLFQSCGKFIPDLGINDNLDDAAPYLKRQPGQLRAELEVNHYFLPIRIGSGNYKRFMVDTGASALAMSTEELENSGAAYKIRNAFARATLADGSIIVGKIVTIAEVDVGGILMKNVRAFVCDTCSKLAGQSLLTRFDMRTTKDAMLLSPR
ncbi:MAG: SEL1-like repeat protein [Betaproteobacteria bacterium]|nr:SEL1-like repeat protein [Betaproteobacteria bacterium]